MILMMALHGSGAESHFFTHQFADDCFGSIENPHKNL